MSSVLSPTAPIVDVRRRPVRQSALFPMYDAQGPNQKQPWSGGDSPEERHLDKSDAPSTIEAGSGGSSSGSSAVDCPPPLPATGGGSLFADGRTRDAGATLIGIARLAAASPAAETARKSEERPQYFLLPVKSILNRCDSNRVPFEWTINPYRGCEFGCKYCYARYTHEYMELDGNEFEKKIYVKQNAAALLTNDVARKYSYEKGTRGRRRRWAGAHCDRHGDRSVSAGGA